MPNQPKLSSRYVDTPAELQSLVDKLGPSDAIYLDLEADSLYHYQAKICLIQVQVGQTCHLVDTLALQDMHGFFDCIQAKTLVLHGADYDLRMLSAQYGFVPTRIFDTMLAAQLLGHKGLGLAALVQHYLGVQLNKDKQKEDWSERPLPPEMIDYAAHDTVHLPKLYTLMREELNTLGREGWHRESCDALIVATSHPKTPDRENAWRLDGSGRLQPRQLHILKTLWEWRENEAIRRDKPAFRILPSDLLMRFAYSVPTEGQPERIPNLPSSMKGEKKESFLGDFEAALVDGPDKWPKRLKAQRQRGRSPNSQLLSHLRSSRDAMALNLGIDPHLLANKATLTAVALTRCRSLEEMREAAGWMRWQEQLLAQPWLDYASPRNR